MPSSNFWRHIQALAPGFLIFQGGLSCLGNLLNADSDLVGPGWAQIFALLTDCQWILLWVAGFYMAWRRSKEPLLRTPGTLRLASCPFIPTRVPVAGLLWCQEAVVSLRLLAWTEWSVSPEGWYINSALRMGSGPCSSPVVCLEDSVQSDTGGDDREDMTVDPWAGPWQLGAPHPLPCPCNVGFSCLLHTQRLPQEHSLEIVIKCWDHLDGI